jgi:hypothetical protein
VQCAAAPVMAIDECERIVVDQHRHARGRPGIAKDPAARPAWGRERAQARHNVNVCLTKLGDNGAGGLRVEQEKLDAWLSARRGPAAAQSHHEIVGAGVQQQGLVDGMIERARLGGGAEQPRA